MPSSGKGPPILKTANWLNHLEFDWQSPVWTHWFNLFSSHHTLYRYDIRGSGLSDWTDNKLSFDDQVADLECVADAAGLEKFALLGISQGASVAIEYAVRHPERVDAPGHPRRLRAWLGEARSGHGARRPRLGGAGARGLGNVAYRCIPAHVRGAVHSPRDARSSWTGSPSCNAAARSLRSRRCIMEATGNIDVVDRLAQVQAPTLVMHPRGDVIVPFDAGRVIAGGIAHAKFVEFDSANHLLLENEPAWQKFREVVGEFLGWPREAPLRRAADRPADREDLATLTGREREILEPGGGRCQQPGNRRPAVHQREDRAQSPHGHLRQDRRELALAGHRVCAGQRAGRPTELAGLLSRMKRCRRHR